MSSEANFFDIYSHRILDLAANASQLRVRKSAYDLARQVGMKMGSWSTEEPIRIAHKIYEICGP